MDWQRCYEEGFTPWDKGGFHPGLPAALEIATGLVGGISGRVLVPGCGPGHDLAAWDLPQVTEIVGVDIAPSAVTATAQRFADNPKMQAKLADFLASPEVAPTELGKFDWLWEHTCFCAIPRELRAAYATSAYHALAPDGHFLAMFYLRPWDAHEDQNQGPPFGVTAAELDAQFQPYFQLLHTWEPSQTYPGREHKEEVRLYRRREQPSY